MKFVIIVNSLLAIRSKRSIIWRWGSKKKIMKFKYKQYYNGKYIDSDTWVISPKKNAEKIYVTSCSLKDGNLIIKYYTTSKRYSSDPKEQKRLLKKFGSSYIKIKESEYSTVIYNMRLFDYVSVHAGKIHFEYNESEIKSNGKRYKPICFNVKEFVKHDYEVIQKDNEIIIKDVKGFTIGLYY